MPTILRPASTEEIEAHLIELGGGNHEDNMKQVRGAQHYYLLVLTEEDFLGLVFLKTDDVAPICGVDRRLSAVAVRAAALDSMVLGPNWDLGLLRDRGAAVRGKLPALLLRDARHGERSHGTYYLQDGSHRALAYALALRDGVAYVAVEAYLVTDRSLL